MGTLHPPRVRPIQGDDVTASDQEGELVEEREDEGLVLVKHVAQARLGTSETRNK